MESPYRSSELEVVHSAGRADKRCGSSTDACKRMKKPGAGAWMSTALGLLFAGGTLGIAVGGIGAGIRACMAIAEMKPHPVLLTCAPPAKARFPPAPPAPPPPVIEPPTPIDLLGATEPETHDPGVLVVRALAMQSAGLPVKLVVVALPQDAVKKGLGFRVEAAPSVAGGVAVRSIPKGSLPERAGLEEGDVVLSVNGYPAADPKWMDRVRPEPGATTVVELLRDRRRVVLALQWLGDKRR